MTVKSLDFVLKTLKMSKIYVFSEICWEFSKLVPGEDILIKLQMHEYEW